MRRAIAIAIAIGASSGGCTEPVDTHEHLEPPVVHTPGGASIQLPIEGAPEHRVDGERESFTSADGAVWSVQTLDRSISGHGTTLEEVAIALCRRVELGEVPGELTHRDCDFANQAAQCIEGWQLDSEGARFIRRGGLIQAGEDIVWVSLTVRDGGAAIDSLSDLLATGTRVGTSR